MCRRTWCEWRNVAARTSLAKAWSNFWSETAAGYPTLITSFDKVLCVHTIYFWKEPIKDFGEMFRVLRPGGRLVLGFRAMSDKGSTSDFPETVYAFYSIQEVSTLLESAGFEKSAIWNAGTPPGEMCLAVARRPQ
jgi:SAM-dependent methyltransferase